MSSCILKLRAVMQKTGLSRSTIYLKIKSGEFPKPISLGIRSVGWIENDVENWISGRIDASR